MDVVAFIVEERENGKGKKKKEEGGSLPLF